MHPRIAMRFWNSLTSAVFFRYGNMPQLFRPVNAVHSTVLGLLRNKSYWYPCGQQESRTNTNLGSKVGYSPKLEVSAGVVVLCVNTAILASSFGVAALVAIILQRPPAFVP